MDNFHLDVTSHGNSTLRLALRLAGARHAVPTATRWANTEVPGPSGDYEPTMILLWRDDPRLTCHPFPVKLKLDGPDLDSLVTMVSAWLAEVEPVRPVDMGDNGSTCAAFRVFTPSFEITPLYAICAIQPVHGIIHK